MPEDLLDSGLISRYLLNQNAMGFPSTLRICCDYCVEEGIAMNDICWRLEFSKKLDKFGKSV